MSRTTDHLLPSEALPAIGDNSVVFHNGAGYYYTCRDYCLSPDQRVFSCVNPECEATASMGPGLGAPLIDNGYHCHNADLSYRDKCIVLHTIRQRFIKEESLPSVILRDVLASFQFEEAAVFSEDADNVGLQEHSLYSILKEEPSMEMEVQSVVIDEQQTGSETIESSLKYDGALKTVEIQAPKEVPVAVQKETQVAKEDQNGGRKNPHVCAYAEILSKTFAKQLEHHAHDLDTQVRFQHIKKQLQKILSVMLSVQRVQQSTQQDSLLGPQVTYEIEEGFEETQESFSAAGDESLLDGEQEECKVQQSLKPRKAVQPKKILKHHRHLDQRYEAESARIFEVEHESEIPYEPVENTEEIESEIVDSFRLLPSEEEVSRSGDVSVPDHIIESILNPDVNLGRQRRHAITDKDGYMYCVNRKIGNKIYLRCSRFRQGCYARAALQPGGQVITQTNYSHNHRPDPHRVAIREFTAAVIAEVQNVLANQGENDTYRPLMDIYTEMIERYPNLAPHVSYQLVRRAVKRANLFYR